MNRSEALFERAKNTIPGGVNSPVRAFKAVGGTPRFMERSDGAYIWDADGQRYIDYVLSWGPMIMGHNHPEVREAVIKAAETGLSFGCPTEIECEAFVSGCECRKWIIIQSVYWQTRCSQIQLSIKCQIESGSVCC